MKTLLIMLIAMILCSLSLALPQMDSMQNVGGDFGKSWLTQYSDKFVISSVNNSNDLWKWGGKPLGYEVFQGRLYPLLAPTEYYYPGFIANTTPIYLNGTALMRNQQLMYVDFMSPSFVSDPWLMAQMTERPVVIVYPSEDKKHTLL